MGLILTIGLVLLIAVAVATVAIVHAIKKGRTITSEDWNNWVSVPSIIVALICLALILGLALWSPLGKSHTAAELEAFFDANSAVYEDAVTMTGGMLTITLERLPETTLIPVQGSVEKLELGKATAAAITEWRRQVVWYNEEIQWYRIADKSWLVGSLYPTLPDKLVPIKLQTGG